MEHQCLRAAARGGGIAAESQCGRSGSAFDFDPIEGGGRDGRLASSSSCAKGLALRRPPPLPLPPAPAAASAAAAARVFFFREKPAPAAAPPVRAPNLGVRGRFVD